MKQKETKFDCYTLEELEELIKKTRNKNPGYEQLEEYIDIQSVLIELVEEVRRQRNKLEALGQ